MRELIEKAKKGDREAFTQIIIELEDILYKIARIRLSCDADIEDAVQETILESFKSINKLKQIDYFKTWLIKILINNCNKIYNKRKKENNLFEKNKINSFII